MDGCGNYWDSITATLNVQIKILVVMCDKLYVDWKAELTDNVKLDFKEIRIVARYYAKHDRNDANNEENGNKLESNAEL